ncbi:D-arabinono-1,4-lactone oxidase [Schumannella luteola]
MTDIRSPLVRAGVLEPGGRWRNWGRSESSHPRVIARAHDVEEVVETVAFARDEGLTVKPIGAGHSFTAIGATDGVQLDISAIDGVLSVDGNLVTLGAGTNLYQLPALLEPHGLALTNMGDIDRQTIAGATSTGTHGTGAAFGGLATQLRGVTLVTADGEVLKVSADENSELLPAAVLGLGALGVLVDVTVECVPAFVLSAVEKPEPIETVLEEWADRIAAHDHFEFYVWPHTDTVLTKTNTRLPIDAERNPLGAFQRWFDDDFMANGVYRATLNLGRAIPPVIPPLNRLSVKLTGDRRFADVSPKVFTTHRTVRFREMEYALPVEHIPEAIRRIRALIDEKGWRISFPIEVRASAPDDLWMSTATGRATGYIAVHRYFREDPIEYFSAIEAIFREYDGRPHWGKMHTRSAENLVTTYPRFGDFVALRDRLDPERLFTNPYLDRVLGA